MFHVIQVTAYPLFVRPQLDGLQQPLKTLDDHADFNGRDLQLRQRRSLLSLRPIHR
ncbi:MAG: hypothetical protein JNJ61_07255 [Anaerolineae bacterium]|nr:hypothetical protein [Anaerolineae bacterium]